MADDARPKSFTPSVFKGSEEVVECPCTPCARDGTDKEAVNFCSDCSEYYCLDCTKQHTKFGFTTTHDVVDRTKAKQAGGRKKATPGQLPTERCREHPGELITSFCKDHDAVVCNSCASMDHRSCDKVVYIPIVSGDSKTRQAVPRVKAEVTASLTSTKETRVQVQKHKTMIDDEKAKHMATIKDNTKRLINHALEMEKSAIAGVTRNHQGASKTIVSELASLDELESILQKRLASLDNAQTKNDSQVFVDTNLGTREAKAAKELEKRLKSSGNDHVKSTFVVDDSVDVVINDVPSLGKVVECKPFKAVPKDKYDIKKKGDECVVSISDSCEQPSGDILMTDYFNCCIKALNKSYKVVKKFKMPSNPWGICKTSLNEVAAALPNCKRVQFVDTSGNMKLTTSFPVEERCRGLAYSSGELFVSCGGHPGTPSANIDPEGPPFVAVYDRSGSIRRKFQMNGLGKQIFSVPYHIVTSHNGTKIHISDRMNGVITVDRTGVVTSTFSERIKWAHGLCTVGTCYLIVCGNKSNNVLQMTTDGELVTELLNTKDDLNKPFSVIYSPEKSTLAVTFQNSTELKVFNLHI